MMRSEEGYSLVESLVAMAILLAVLVPSAMFLTYIGNNILAKEKIESFNLARNQMELALATQNDSTFTKQIDHKWWVEKVVIREKDLRTIRVSVFKEDTLNVPVITLQTARLWYKEE